MPSFRTDFHATLEELTDLVTKVISAIPIVTTGEDFDPAKFQNADPRRVELNLELQRIESALRALKERL